MTIHGNGLLKMGLKIMKIGPFRVKYGVLSHFWHVFRAAIMTLGLKSGNLLKITMYGYDYNLLLLV